ncbi:phosphatase PAP2 family protein [Metabacillus elymi]|uniref:Phosphatase PAP2 family protein n=1 Tax=Metabacillus elymi TaxID=2745198 RepID=A0ABX6S975_9BACI|nr:phosphatase PAP2 family protein [Metabacillus sp. KUDC1714]QNF30544.1 phosphatase PAP2 family protein [Metabacillus sp. KUDC1714]
MIKWFIVSLFIFLLCAIIYPYEVIGSLDNNVTLFFEKVRSPLLNDVFLFISDIGSIKYMLPICFVIAVILLIRRKVIDVVFLFVMLYSVRQLNYQLKEQFLRERPSFNAVYEAAHYSFPSGHSMNSMAVYSFICYLLIRYLSNTNKQNKTLLISTITLIFLIGLSRIYLGVHYLTDVVAGFSAGFVWFIVLTTIIAKINQLFDKKRLF